MKKSLIFVTILLIVAMTNGCSKTWEGAKRDTSSNAQWSKDKVNDGAQYIERKSE